MKSIGFPSSTRPGRVEGPDFYLSDPDPGFKKGLDPDTK